MPLSAERMRRAVSQTPTTGAADAAICLSGFVGPAWHGALVEHVDCKVMEAIGSVGFAEAKLPLASTASEYLVIADPVLGITIEVLDRRSSLGCVTVSDLKALISSASNK